VTRNGRSDHGHTENTFITFTFVHVDICWKDLIAYINNRLAALEHLAQRTCVGTPSALMPAAAEGNGLNAKSL